MKKYLGGIVLAPVLVIGSAPVLADKHGMGEPDCTVEISRKEMGSVSLFYLKYHNRCHNRCRWDRR